MITLSNVSKNFGKLKALDSVSFQIAKGEVVGLLGPNGAGKTTTMRVLTSFLSPDSGEVKINGKSIFPQSSDFKKMIGYLPEGTPLYNSMRVEEFLLYCAQLKGLRRKESRKAIEKPLEQCQLGDVRKRVIGELSKGYRQRVGLAQALISDPMILILDEPTVGLDPSQVVQVRALIKELRKDRTIILSTHILSEVEAVCEKVIVMHRGSIVKEALLKDLTSPLGGVTRITLSLKGDAETFIDSCKNVEDIVSVKTSADGKIMIEAKTSKEDIVREKLFQTAVSNGAVLMEMRKEKINLEAIFLELTQTL